MWSGLRSGIPLPTELQRNSHAPVFKWPQHSPETVHELFNSCQKHLWEIKSLCSKEVRHRTRQSWTVKNVGSILSKQTQPWRLSEKFNYSCRALEVLFCCIFGSHIHWSQVPSSFKILLVSDFNAELFRISIRALKTWKAFWSNQWLSQIQEEFQNGN